MSHIRMLYRAGVLDLSPYPLMNDAECLYLVRRFRCVCVYVRVYVRVYVCVFVCVYVCVCVCVSLHE